MEVIEDDNGDEEAPRKTALNQKKIHVCSQHDNGTAVEGHFELSVDKQNELAVDSQRELSVDKEINTVKLELFQLKIEMRIHDSPTKGEPLIIKNINLMLIWKMCPPDQIFHLKENGQEVIPLI